MKILFITGSLNQGGAEYQILELAKLFKNKGHEIEVFAITDYDFYLPFIEKNQIPYKHLLNNQSKFRRVYLTSKKIRETKPALVISYLRSTSQVALFAKWLSLTKVRLIIGERTSLVLPRYDNYYFNLMRFSNAITVNSISKLEYLRNKFPRITKKVNFFPNIIDTDYFDFISKNHDGQNFKIGYIGRISPEKNVFNLVKAFHTVYEGNKTITLDLYGDTRNELYLQKIEVYIQSNNLENCIQLKGKTTDVASVYKELSALCLLSDFEGFSNVLSEALCSGLPIITSNIPENTYLVEDRVNGFVVNQQDVISIAKGLEKMVSLSIDELQQMSLNNRKKAEQIFDKQKIYEDYMELINKILS